MKRRDNKAFTLIEVVITIAIIAIVGAILAPMVSSNIRSARLARAQSDTANIGKAILDFKKDLDQWPVYRGGARRLLFSSHDVDLNGVPDTGSIAPTWSVIPVADRLSLYFELIDNGNNRDASISTDGTPRWLGPYLTQMGEDPWGNCYLVNAEWLTNKSGGTLSVFVLSAGPGRPASIETPFNGAPPADSDDIVFRLQ